MPSLFADLIFVFTGMRSVAFMPNLWRRLIPARQLWHPVSVSADIVMVLGDINGTILRADDVYSAFNALALMVIVGCGFDLPLFHVLVN